MKTLRIRKVAEKLGVSTKTVIRWSEGEVNSFPKGFLLSEGVRVWDEAELDEWILTKKRAALAASTPQEAHHGYGAREAAGIAG